MHRIVSVIVIALALAGCDTPPAAPEPAPRLRGIPVGLVGATPNFGQLALGEPTIDGPLSPEPLEDVFLDRGHEIQFCYQRAVQNGSSVPSSGRLVVTFTIAPTGRVTPPVSFTEDTLGSASLTDCVAQTVAGWAFPPPSTDVHVGYPLDLSYDPGPPG